MGKLKWNKSAVERAAIISGGCALLVAVISLVASFLGQAEMNIAVDTNVQIVTPGPISDKLDACENPNFLTDTLTAFVPYVPPDTKSTSVLEVAESVAQPEDMEVPQASRDIPISAIDLTVRGDENIKLDYIEVEISGMGSLNAIQNVKVFDGLDEKGSNDVQQNGVTRIDLRNDPIAVEAGKRKTIVLAADFRNGCVGHSFRLGLNGSSKLWAVGEQTGGNVEIKLEEFEGPEIKIAAPKTSSITLKKTRLVEDRVAAGDKNVVLGRYEVVNSGFQRAMIQAFFVENREKKNRASNIRLIIGDDIFEGKVSSDGRMLFDLCADVEGSDDWNGQCNSNVIVGQNEQVEFVFVGDIVDGERGDKVTLAIGDGMDFLTVGMQSGFGGKVMFQDESGELYDNWTEAMEETIYLQ